MQVVWEHDALGRDVELFQRHMYSTEKVGPTVKGYEAAELVEGLEIHEGGYKLVKTRTSAFFSTYLHSFLLTSGINSLVIVGIQLQIASGRLLTLLLHKHQKFTPSANIFDMENIGVATPTLEEWRKADD